MPVNFSGCRCKVQFGLLVPLLCEPCAGKSRFWRLGVDHGRLWGWEKNDMLIHFHAKMTSKRVATVNWQHGALDHSRLFCLLRFLSDLWCFFSSRKKGVKLAVNQSLVFFLQNPIGKHPNMCIRSLTRTEGENCVKNPPLEVCHVM